MNVRFPINAHQQRQTLLIIPTWPHSIHTVPDSHSVQDAKKCTTRKAKQNTTTTQSIPIVRLSLSLYNDHIEECRARTRTPTAWPTTIITKDDVVGDIPAHMGTPSPHYSAVAEWKTYRVNATITTYVVTIMQHHPRLRPQTWQRQRRRHRSTQHYANRKIITENAGKGKTTTAATSYDTATTTSSSLHTAWLCKLLEQR